MSHPTSHPVPAFHRAESARAGIPAPPQIGKPPATGGRTVSPVVRNAIVYPVQVRVSPPGFVHDFQI